MFHRTKRKIDLDLLEIFRRRPCDSCGRGSSIEYPSHPAHIKSRGSGGNDEEENLLSFCAKCHHNQHLMGWHKFVGSNLKLIETLDKKGWTLLNKRMRRKDECPDT
jgi:hypothetical protein